MHVEALDVGGSMMVAEYRNWTFEVANQNELDNIWPLFSIITKLFQEIFGEKAIFSEPCIIYNDPTAKCPRIIWEQDGYLLSPIKIRLSLPRFTLWSKAIYQLSHELTHYVIRQYKPDKQFTLSWFEESLCEAMSLYTLKLVAERWSECTLSQGDPVYAVSITEYWREEYSRRAPSVLQQCTSLEQLQDVEISSQENRELRLYERNYLFDTFVEMPTAISDFVFYTWFMRDKLRVDFDAWRESTVNGSLVPKLEVIQPRILSA